MPQRSNDVCLLVAPTTFMATPTLLLSGSRGRPCARVNADSGRHPSSTYALSCHAQRSGADTDIDSPREVTLAGVSMIFSRWHPAQTATKGCSEGFSMGLEGAGRWPALSVA